MANGQQEAQPYPAAGSAQSSNSNGKAALDRWKMVIVLVITWALTLAVQWGTNTQKNADMERRVTTLEDKALTKDQFQEFHQDLVSRLGRIEENQKLMEKHNN